jgi:hypothetical protein
MGKISDLSRLVIRPDASPKNCNSLFVTKRP